MPALSPSKNTPQVDADDDDPQSICSPCLSILDEDIDRLSDNTNHQSRFFSRSSSLCSSTKIVSSRKRRQRSKLNDTTKTRQYNDTSTNLSPTVPQPRSPRLHSPRLTDLGVIQPESNRIQRNLDRINYCELDTTDPEQLFSLTLDNSSDAAAKINTDQHTIGWEHFIRGRLSLSFIPIVDSYYHINKLGRRFTSNKWLTAVIASHFEIHQQAWIEFYSANTRKSSTEYIVSPKQFS